MTTNHGTVNRGRVSHAATVALLLTVTTFVALAIAWNVLIPPFEGLDELEHFEVVRYVASTGQLPVHDTADGAGYRVRQEASQPPFYYYLAAAWTRLWALPTTPPNPQEVPARLVACGSTVVPYNKATWLHDPVADAPPWTGALSTLHALRLFSTLLQVVTLCGVWTLARRFHPGGRFAAVVTGIVAFNPQLLLLAAGVNNDNAAIPLATWGLVLAYDLWNRQPALWRSVSLGVVCGAAALSKLSGIALLGVAALAIMLGLVQRRTPFRSALVQGLLIVGIATTMVSPWLLRNLRLYGDPTALAPMLAKVGRRAAALDWGEARLLLLSYWGQLPCAFYPRSIYWPYLVLMVGGAVGTALAWPRLPSPKRTLLALCACWFTVIVASWVRWTSMTPASGGRLLFPAIGAASMLIAVGWQALHQRFAIGWGALLPIWALVALMTGPVPILLPPSVQRSVPVAADHTLASFGDAIGLVDYSVLVSTQPAACLLSSQAYCGATLDLALDWQVLAPIKDDLTFVIQLVDAAPGSTDLRLNYNYWPGRGNLRTSIWPTDHRIRDHYLLPLPSHAGVTQAWDLVVAFVDPDTGRRLPVATLSSLTTDSAVLARVRVPDRQPQAPTWDNPTTPADFGEQFRLIDAGLARTGGNWQVDLLWESLAGTHEDLITFVHAYDTDGDLIATGDGAPLGGAFPTSFWVPGDRVLSTHHLTIPQGAVGALVSVGLYNADTGARVAASSGGEPLPNDALVIWARDP